MTTTKLKIFAVFCMLIDHIAVFIPNMPFWFHWIGRFSAPIFAFCLSWGFFYTRNRKLYLKRLYILGVGMGLANTISSLYFCGTKNVQIENNIFTTFFIATLIIWITDIYNVDKKRGKHYIKLFIIVQVISSLLIFILGDLMNIIILNREQLIGALTANIFLCEGGLPFAFLPLIIYYSKHKKKKMALYYISFWIFYTLFYITDFVPRVVIHIQSLLPESLKGIAFIIPEILGMNWIPTYHQPWYLVLDYRWMLIFALPFMLIYNGKKGKGFKYFFYWFYPTHIYILFLMGVLLKNIKN